MQKLLLIYNKLIESELKDSEFVQPSNRSEVGL